MFRQFIESIVKSLRSRGLEMNMPTRCDVFESSEIEYIRQRFSYFKKNGCSFVMFFTEDKLDPVHHTFKLMEVEFGIITQHISKPTMEKAIGQRGAQMVIDNVLLKSNLKLGGINHGLSTAKAMAQFRDDIVYVSFVCQCIHKIHCL